MLPLRIDASNCAAAAAGSPPETVVELIHHARRRTRSLYSVISMAPSNEVRVGHFFVFGRNLKSRGQLSPTADRNRSLGERRAASSRRASAASERMSWKRYPMCRC